MIIPRQTIQRLCEEEKLIDPWFDRREFIHTKLYGGTIKLSGGLSPAGYDIHVDNGVFMNRLPGFSFQLASSLERFKMPDYLMAQVCDKSTWARMGLFVQNTLIEPGWEGYLTLELTYHGRDHINILPGTPIAQVIFMRLETATNVPYAGKYQNQEPGPQKAR